MSSTTAPLSPPGDDAWVPEPLAPGALGYEPPAETDASGAGTAEPPEELPPLPLTGPLAQALAAARTGLDDAADAASHLADVGPQQRVQALRALAEARHVADATLVRLAASFGPADLLTLGMKNGVDLLLRHTGASPARAKAETVLASALTGAERSLPPDYVPVDLDDEPGGPVDAGQPEPDDGDGGDGEQRCDQPSGGVSTWSSAVELGRLGAAHATGRVSTDVAALATRAVASLPAALRRTHGGAADDLLARALPGMSHEQARIFCAALVFALDPDRADRGFDPDDLDKRYLTLTLHDDGWATLRALLDPDTAAELKAFLDARAKPAPTVQAPLADETPDDADDDADDDGDGDGGDSGSVSVRDDRTPGQRRHDALAEAARAARASSGTTGGEPVRVIVTATADQLSGVPGSGPATCETTGRAVSGARLARIACCGALQALQLSCEGADARVLALGRSVRLFTASQRRAMLARDGGCVIPGCDAPPAMLEAHHTTDWADGGLTDVDHGVLACTRHHLLVTVGAWEVTMVAGVPLVRPPASVDPLRRWVRNPRRALQDAARRAARHLVEQSPARGRHLNLLDPPDGWADDPPGDPPRLAPDIPSPRSTCDC